MKAHRTVGSRGDGSEDCRLTWVKAHRGACFSPWPRHPDRHTALPSLRSNTVFEKTYFRKVTGTFWQKCWTFLEISENTNKFDMDVIRSQWVVIQNRVEPDPQAMATKGKTQMKAEMPSFKSCFHYPSDVCLQA